MVSIGAVYFLIVFLLVLDTSTVHSLLPSISSRLLSAPLGFNSYSISAYIISSIRCRNYSPLQMSTLTAPPQIQRSVPSITKIELSDTVSIQHLGRSNMRGTARSSFVKQLTVQNKKNMKDGIRLREKYKKYRLMTTTEEMTAGKFSAVGKKLKNNKASLIAKLGREISIEEWARSCKLNVQQLELYLSVAKRAQNQLFQHNMNLVDFHARSIIEKTSVGKEVPYYQLVAEGTVGLREAVESYDGRGRFSIYANPFIRSRIMRALTSLRPGSVLSHNAVMTYARALKAKARLAIALGREPTVREIASELNLSIANVESALRDAVVKKNSISAQSVLAVNEYNEPTTYLDLFLSARQNARSDDSTTWHSDFVNALACLEASERRTIELRYGLLDGNARSVRDTAELMAVSEEAVRKLVNSSFEKLRTSSSSKLLEEGVPQSAITTINGRVGVTAF